MEKESKDEEKEANIDELPKEIPETAINYDSAVTSWLPHTKGRETTCKLFQILPCNFRFFGGGRIMMGPGIPFWIYLVVILTGVNISFIFLDVVPFYETKKDGIIGFILVFLSITSIYCLVRIAFTDPGYVLPHWFSNQYTWITKDNFKTLERIYQRHGYTSYCRICKIFQYPDTYHCEECHACIDGGDHHCHILGTCVGRRNYRFFYIFIITTNTALCLALVMTILHFIENWMDFGVLYALAHAVTFYLILSTLVFPPLSLYVLILLPFAHTRMIYIGRTLNQGKTSWDTRDFSLSQRRAQFLRTFYKRVIETPPKTQISHSVLQFTVRMPAVPRTEVANEHHHILQNQYPTPKADLVFTIRQQLLSFKIRLIHMDMDFYKNCRIPFNLLRKFQADTDIEAALEAARATLPTSQQQKEEIKVELPPSPQTRRKRILLNKYRRIQPKISKGSRKFRKRSKCTIDSVGINTNQVWIYDERMKVTFKKL